MKLTFSLCLSLLSFLACSQQVFAQAETERKITIKTITKDANGNEKTVEQTFDSIEDFKASMSDSSIRFFDPNTLGNIKIKTDISELDHVFGDNPKEKAEFMEFFRGVGSMDSNILRALQQSNKWEDLQKLKDGSMKDIELMILEESQKGQNGSELMDFIPVITLSFSPISTRQALKTFPETIDSHKEIRFNSINTQTRDGELQLDFSAPKKEVTISVTDKKGDYLFLDRIVRFSGDYSKAIDISAAEPGEYLLQVSQGRRLWTQLLKLEKSL